jgi:hypothetical protein
LYASVRAPLATFVKHISSAIGGPFADHLPVAMWMRVLPVSTMPAVFVRMGVEVPYRMDWSIPQDWSEGLVVVMGLSSRG